MIYWRGRRRKQSWPILRHWLSIYYESRTLRIYIYNHSKATDGKNYETEDITKG